MKRLTKYLKLPEPETFTIQTKLSKSRAIGKMERLVGRSLIFSSFFWGESDDPRFIGKILENGFEVYLARDVVGRKMPVFSPPKIKGTIIGENSVQIRTTLKFTKFQRLFFAIFSGFAIFWLCLWALIPILGLIFGMGAEACVPAPEQVMEIEGPKIDGEFNAKLLLVPYLLPFLAIPICFVWLPRRLLHKNISRSKELMLELFGADIVASN